MKQVWLSLLSVGILLASAGTVVAGGSVAGSGSSNHFQQGSREKIEQRGMQPASETSQNGQKSPENGTTQDTSDRLLDQDNDRLKDLEKELSREQLIDRHDRGRLTEK